MGKRENRAVKEESWLGVLWVWSGDLSHKEGFEASASVDIITADYNKQKLVDFHGTRYRVIRAFQRRPDYTTLILEEVVR